MSSAAREARVWAGSGPGLRRATRHRLRRTPVVHLALCLSFASTACVVDEEVPDDERRDDDVVECLAPLTQGSMVHDREVYSRGNDDEPEGFAMLGFGRNIARMVGSQGAYDRMAAEGRQYWPGFTINRWGRSHAPWRLSSL